MLFLKSQRMQVLFSAFIADVSQSYITPVPNNPTSSTNILVVCTHIDSYITFHIDYARVMKDYGGYGEL